MSIQGLMQKGLEDCSYLEKTADIFLKIPRAMWLNRKVTVTNVAAAKLEIENKEAFSFLNVVRTSFGPSSPLDGKGLIVMGPIYLIFSILAMPVLALGLTCKKIALHKDPKANAYHEILENSYHYHELTTQINNLTNKKSQNESMVEEIKQEQIELTNSSESSIKISALIQQRLSELKPKKLSLENELVNIDISLKKINEEFTPLQIHIRVLTDKVFHKSLIISINP